MSSLLPKLGLRDQLALGNTTHSLRQSLATQVGGHLHAKTKVVGIGVRSLSYKNRGEVFPPLLQLQRPCHAMPDPDAAQGLGSVLPFATDLSSTTVLCLRVRFLQRGSHELSRLFPEIALTQAAGVSTLDNSVLLLDKHHLAGPCVHSP